MQFASRVTYLGPNKNSNVLRHFRRKLNRNQSELNADR